MLDERLKERAGKGSHLCWFPDCGAVWPLDAATYCPVCDTWKCPSCGRCFCDLPPFTQHVLDAEMASLDLWDPWHNPPRRKKRRKTPFEMTRSEFLSYAERSHPSLYARYRSGEFDFEGLRGRVMAKIDRIIRIRG